MAMMRSMLELLIVVTIMAVFTSGKPSLNIEEVGLYRINPALYKMLEGESDDGKPECPPRPRNPNAGGGGKKNDGERINFTVIADGSCCVTTTHQAPVGHHFYLVLSSVQKLENNAGQSGTVSFVDVLKNLADRIIITTQEDMSKQDPVILKRTESSSIVVRVCGHNGEKTKVVYSASIFNPNEAGAP